MCKLMPKIPDLFECFHLKHLLLTDCQIIIIITITILYRKTQTNEISFKVSNNVHQCHLGSRNPFRN